VKISIVTISYNQAKYLKKCIYSVLFQNYNNVEYIVVDPGSKDNSRQIIESYGSSIISIFEADDGPSDGLNKGFSKATGDIFGFINSDDILLPGALTHVSKVFHDHPEIDILCGNGYQLDGFGNVVRKLYSTTFTARRYAYSAVNIVQPATFFRREIFEKVGGFNVHNRLFWDGELFVRMALAHGQFFRTSKFLGGFRLYPQSSSGGMGDYAGYVQANLRLREEILQRHIRQSDILFVLFYKAIKFIFNPQYAYSALLWRLSGGKK
jgi:glycosyltransferase involved in cell wall biosynthesis